jgi:hypothetical protein
MVAVGAMLAAIPSGLAQPFVEVGAAAGLRAPHRLTVPTQPCDVGIVSCLAIFTGGVAVGDIDGDGWPDVVLTRPELATLVYINQRDGSFSELSGAPVGDLLNVPGANGVALVDVDLDGDLDLLIARVGFGGPVLLLNHLPGPFEDASVVAGLDGGDEQRLHAAFSLATGDFDRDGRVDLYLTEWTGETRCGGAHERLYRGLGAGGTRYFEDVTGRMGVTLTGLRSPVAWSFAAGFTDLDADGWPDLLVTGDFGTSRLFYGRGSDAYLEATESAGVGTEGFGMGATVADFNGDGRFDIYVTSVTFRIALDWQRSGNRMYLGESARRFRDATSESGTQSGGWGWGVAALDSDHDGDMDIVSAAGLHNQLGAHHSPLVYYENSGDAVFTERASQVGLTNTQPTRGLVVFDYDRDGDQDVLIVRHGDTPLLYRNDGGAALGDWLRVRAQGTRGNRQGLGAVVRVTVDGRTWLAETNSVTHFLGQSEQVAHVGLGAAAQSRVATVQVTFLGGHVVTLENVALNQELTVVEPDLPFPNAPAVVPAAAPDCDGDGEDDACAPDCDGNRRPDSCDVRDGLVADCNVNGVPDSCETASGFERDCDENGVLDVCDLGGEPERDCDGNGLLDACELAAQPWLDCNEDGALDACHGTSCTDAGVRDLGVGGRDAGAGHDAGPAPDASTEGDAGGRRDGGAGVMDGATQDHGSPGSVGLRGCAVGGVQSTALARPAWGLLLAVGLWRMRRRLGLRSWLSWTRAKKGVVSALAQVSQPEQVARALSSLACAMRWGIFRK